MTKVTSKPILEWGGSVDDQDEWEWQDLVDELTTRMHKINPSGDWHIEVRNFGWRKLDGYSDMHALEGGTLLSRILPNTDCNFRIYRHGSNGLAINNTHHDSPVWGVEWYYIVPQTKKNKGVMYAVNTAASGTRKTNRKSPTSTLKTTK